MGRASGGQLIFVNNRTFASKLIFANDQFLFIELKKDNFKLVVGTVYISPLADTELALSNLDTHLNFIQSNYIKYPILVEGDFNARLGDLNQLDSNIYISPFLNNSRKNLDVTCNARGKELTDLMEHFVLNGRSMSDPCGGYTYTDTQDKSTVDLAWVNSCASEICTDFEIRYAVQPSDHFPVCVKIV